MSKLTIYHGSEYIIQKPTYGLGKIHNDFGLGFYCTEYEDLAKEWACSSLSGGYASRYTIETDGLNILHINSSEFNILNWIAVLVANRLFKIKTPVANRAKRYLTEHFYLDVNAYDIITGYRADDSYFDFADAFLNNAITVKQLAYAMRLGKLGEQIVIKSPQAFGALNYEGYSKAEPNIYYPLRKSRDTLATQEYLKILEQEEDGLYMADIMREKVKQDDPRLSGNISE